MSVVDEARRDEPHGRAATAASLLDRGGWRWAAVPLALIYLVLLAMQFGAVVRASDLDADAVSAEVIGQLFGHAGAHAYTVLGTFGWYATLLAELATRWLPSHRYVWEAMPYGMSLASVALIGWSVWWIAGRWAASIAAVLLLCTSPAMLLLLLSMTQHGPDWFCCALLGAFIVAIEQRRRRWRLPPMLAAAVVIGVVVGVNAASDALVILAGVLPFGLALLVSHTLAWREQSRRSLGLAAVMFVALAVSWRLTHAVMSAWRVAPEAGLKLFTLGTGHHVGKNVGLWLQAIPTLANGAFFNRNLSVGALLAVACAGLSLVAVAMVFRFGWREFGAGVERWRQPRGAPAAGPFAPEPERLAFVVFWVSAAVALSLLFVLSSYPVDVKADRYLAGVIYAVAAVIPLFAAGRRRRELAVVLGTCVFALSGIASLRLRLATQQPVAPTSTVANRVAAAAAAHGLTYGFGEYWDAAPITWTTDLRVRIYPVQACDAGRHLCPFDLHVISGWYTPRPGTRSFLLVDPAHRGVTRPTPDLGSPSAVYRVGKLKMYVYPYDIASRLDTRYEQWLRP